MNVLYDTIGKGYANQRKSDPRIAAIMLETIGDPRSVIAVGADTGSQRLIIATQKQD